MKRTSLKYFLKNEIKDIKITAYREMQIDRLDYLSSMSESESINYKLIFIDFKNFKKINVAWGDEFTVIVQRELVEKDLKKY